MAWHRKIDVRMWGDEKFRSLSKPKPNAQSLWQYLLTGPHTTAIPGLSCIGEMALAEALDWPLEGFRKAFREVFAKGLAKADWKARVVFIPNAIKYNPPESPNVVKGWGKWIDSIPECQLKRQAIKQLKDFLEGFPKAFREAFAQPSANQEQEQEQELNTPTPPSFSSARAGIDKASRKIVDHYQETVKPKHDKSRGVLNVSKLLRSGLSEESLINAARGYADDCQKKQTGPVFRKAVGHFYGEDATYEEYMEWKPKAPETASDWEKKPYFAQG